LLLGVHDASIHSFDAFVIEVPYDGLYRMLGIDCTPMA
jgi:hypothetical protein